MPPSIIALRRRKHLGHSVDRASADDARAVLARLVPVAQERACIVAAMIAGVRRAHAGSEGCWSLTLLSGGLRLSVGRLMLLEVLDGHVWACVREGHPAAESLRRFATDDGRDPASAGAAMLKVLIPVGELPGVREALVALVEDAAVTASRSAPQSAYRASWSSGVARLLEEEADTTLPRPAWSSQPAAPPEGMTQAEIDALHQALREPDLSADALAGWRASFNARFGPEKLAVLSGRELLEHMHRRQEHHSLTYWLEFKDDETFPTKRFGSISGGSALKFEVFQRAEDGAWVTGSSTNMQVIDEGAAIAIAERQRDELLMGFDVLDALPDDATDGAWEGLGEQMARAMPTVHGLAFAHKVLALWCPDRLDDFHSRPYQSHILASLGIVFRGSTVYDAAPIFVGLWQHLRASYFGLDMGQLTRAMFLRYGAPHGHWRVGSTDGDKLDVFPHMQRGRYVAVGWEGLGDLGELIGGLDRVAALEALKARLAVVYPKQTASVRTKSAKQLYAFLTRIKVGDLVYVAKGQAVRGVARVEGPYQHVEDGGPWPHRRPVTWLDVEGFKAPSRNGLQTTVHNLANAFDIQAAARRHVQTPDAPDAPADPVHVPPKLGRIAEQLSRKGQVILYGPPGTGKTYQAIREAREIVAGAVHGRGWNALTRDEQRALTSQEGRRRLWMCTFHPAFSYEDFIEGLRPRLEGGQLTFEVRDGIFYEICEAARRNASEAHVLLIDEFNRGDAPRIFGELLTLLELDKREQSVTLPTSGRSFAVPPNVRVLATMNTADRSIAHLDAALRRRFGFIEVLPEPEVLAGKRVAGLPLGALLTALNRGLLDVLGPEARNRQIGHAWLMGVDGAPALRSALRFDVLPLIQEFCADDPDLLSQVVGTALYDRETLTFNARLFEPTAEAELIAALVGLDPDALVITEADDGSEDEDVLGEDGDGEDGFEDDEAGEDG